MAFLQDKPQLTNQYLSDNLLQSYLKRFLPPEMLAEKEPSLVRWGDEVIGPILEMGEEAQREEPSLMHYDGWGERVDRIVVSRGWQELKDVAAQEGLVAQGYERKYGEFSRLYQFAKLYLFTPSSAIYTCPLAMTDGAARLIEVYGDDQLKQEVYPRLISRDPQKFWVSGQWMTEKTGGSDVGRSETVAKKDGDSYRLYGDKWFTSAMPSEMAMTLARIEGDRGTVSGSRGLSLFYVKVFDSDGKLNQIQINGLKDKLGTRALPTAELTLDGTPARLMGEVGQGVKNISTLFNITRIYNACCAVSFMGRTLAIARDYAYRRDAFKKTIFQHPLHINTLANLEVEFHGAFHLAFCVTRLLGRVECGQATSEESRLLRILTPLAKLYTAKRALAAVSESLECLGGAGYLEDTGMAQYLRDTQVLSIWEGTTNVLCLDVLRSIEKEESLPPLLEDMERRFKNITASVLSQSREKGQKALQRINQYLQKSKEAGPEFWEVGARAFSYSLCETFIASLLLEHGQWALEQNKPNFATLANWWCRRDLAPLLFSDKAYREEAQILGRWGE